LLLAGEGRACIGIQAGRWREDEMLTTWLNLGVAAIVAFIAAIVAFIGHLQLLTAREQSRIANNRFCFDLFQKRYEVYQELRAIVRGVTSSGRADSAMCVKATEAAERAQFLFDVDLVAYLTKFTNDLRDLESFCEEQAGLQGKDLKENLDKQGLLKSRIKEFRTRGPALFGSYIRFDHKIR
jgi:hypothetical protein